MRLSRRISATALVAAATLLASCGEPAPTTSTTDVASAGVREFSMSTHNMNFLWVSGNAPATQTMSIGGLIALASYPNLGKPTFFPVTNKTWLTFTTTPRFKNNSWQFDFTVSPTGLSDGLYTASIPVTVVGASNNPQLLTIAFAICSTNNCLFLGDSRLTTISVGPTFNWFANDYFSAGGYYYYEYRLFLLPGQTAWIHEKSSSFGGGATIGDPTVAIFNYPSFSAVGYDDDSCAGLSSEFGPLTNNSLNTMEYRVRASTYSGGVTGTETTSIDTAPFGCGGGDDLRSLPSDVVKIMQAKAAAANGSH